MARNEAKVKFTADTRELTAQIRASNSAMKMLNATMKLNQAEFRNSGNQTEFLKNKQKILAFPDCFLNLFGKRSGTRRRP